MEQVELLADLLGKHPQSIEILPGEIAGWVPESIQTYPFLFVEGNLGVPQKVLYKAYMVAVRAYLCLRNDTRKSAPSPQQSNLLDRLTRVILLANPAHQTALNSRKQLIQTHRLDPHRELNFSASLLSCRECAKESILWHHRRWLLRMVYGVPAISGSDSIPEVVSSDTLEAEFSCVFTACNLYPRNYHAWTHRRFCVEAFIASLKSDFPSNPSVLAKEYRRTLEWIESHISDYSAMNYAVNFEKMLPDRSLIEGFLPTKEHAMSLLQSYPDHESLWMYLRGPVTPEDEKESIASMKEVPSVRQFVLRHIVWWTFSRGQGVPLRLLRSILACDYSPEGFGELESLS